MRRVGTPPTTRNEQVATASEAELREVKVRLPMDQVLRLHYTRMKKRENFSQVVSTALTRYFDDFMKP
jgi:hypothetical protein